MTESLREVRRPLIIEQVEDALLAHLREQVSGQCKVEAFPNDPGKYDASNVPAALLIHYIGSQYAPAKGPANTAQVRRMQWALVLLCWSLRGQGGAYNHLEDIRLAVQGGSFAGAGPVEIVRDELDEEIGGLWRWKIVVALPVPAVARTYQTPAPLMRPAISTTTATTR